MNTVVLVRVSIAVKRHHDHGNSYKGKHLIGSGLQFQRFSPLSSWWGAWQHTGKHGTGEVAQFLIWVSRQQEERVTLDLVWASKTSEPPPVTHLVQQGHIS